MAGDRSARIVKYYSRLNLGHFSDHAEDYMLDTRTENTGVEERLDREGGEGSVGLELNCTFIIYISDAQRFFNV